MYKVTSIPANGKQPRLVHEITKGQTIPHINIEIEMFDYTEQYEKNMAYLALANYLSQIGGTLSFTSTADLEAAASLVFKRNFRGYPNEIVANSNTFKCMLESGVNFSKFKQVIVEELDDNELIFLKQESIGLINQTKDGYYTMDEKSAFELSTLLNFVP